MNYDEIFDAIDELYEKKKTDDILVELTEAFYKAAFEYTKDRVQWNFYTREEKIENDSLRTSKHNSFLDNYKVLMRYIDKSGYADVSKLKIEGDRKVLGDFANYVVYKLAVKQR